MTISAPAANITIDKQVPGHWRATLDNPPINTVHDRMYCSASCHSTRRRY
jgi:hypothetical protein